MNDPVANPWLSMALNNAWSNATFYASLQALPEGAFTAPRPGFFPTLCRTINHIYEADLYFLDAFSDAGHGRSIFQRDDVEEPARLAALQAEADMRLASFCNEVTPEILASSRRMERKDVEVRESVAAMLLQLFQHQIHHRGQAHVQLSDAGVKPPQLDEFYLSHNRAPSAKAYWPEG